MFMVMMVVFMSFIVIIIVIVVAFYFGYPGSAGCHLLEVELAGINKFVEIHISVIALHYIYTWIQGLDYLLLAGEFLWLHLGGFVQQHHVAELYLLYHQALQVFIVDVGATESIAAGKLALHAKGVNYCDYAVQFGIDELLRAKLRNAAYGLCNGTGLADAAGFDNDVVELVHLAEFGELRHKVHLEGAADATVLQGHQTVVGAAHYAALFNQVGVYVHLADVVYDDGEFDSLFIGKDAVQESRLAASEVTGHEEYRNLFFFQCYCHFVN